MYIISFSQNDQEQDGISAEAGRDIFFPFFSGTGHRQKRNGIHMCDQMRDDEALTPQINNFSLGQG
jgi:hypothetical protein